MISPRNEACSNSDNDRDVQDEVSCCVFIDTVRRLLRCGIGFAIVPVGMLVCR